MTAAVHAEWTKMRTLPATPWLVLGMVVLTVLTGVAVVVPVDTSHCPTPAGCFEDTTKLSLAGVQVAQVIVVAFAVLAITNEYGTGLIHLTLAADPRRPAVLLAKAAVVTATVLAGGTLGVLASLAAARAILPGNGFTAANGYPALSLADEPTARAAAGTVLYLVLVALLALGVGAALRDTAGAITAVLTGLYIVPIMAEFVSDPQWRERLQELSPMTSGLAIQATVRLDRLPIGPWAGLGVLACWAAAAMTVGLLTFVIRDA